MINFAASFDEQLSPVAPFLFYVVIAGIIFIETGLLVGFFLPGDSLLFSAGLVAAARDDINIVFLVFSIFLAAFIGDQVGYVLGRKIGRPYLEKHKSKRMVRMLERSERFYARYGWWSVVIARYIPWVRTFVPPIAGTVKMNYYKFLSANALGALLWGVGITLAGYYSGSIPWVKDISYALAAFFISASLLVAFRNYLRDRRD
ncbi:MAG: membrane protein [actinobacterium acIB-AMD-7]|jgi:membrane-associated protein|nr:MAG: membrane protein [actinobacterium acIB-AMD-7]